MAFPGDIAMDAPSPLEQLQVAFAAQVAREIVAADGVIDIDETRLLLMVFPDTLMRSCRFVGAGQRLTEAFHRAHREALHVLPLVLDAGHKLDLVTLFHRTCVVDGVLHPKELAVLRRAAARLGLERAEVERHLRGLPGLGTLGRGA